MQQGMIAGRLGQDAKLAHTQGGDAVCNFSVAVDYRDGREKATQWWRCALWGKRAEALAPYLLKGVSVSVIGEQTLTEYEGKPQLNLRVNEVTLQGSRNTDGGQRQEPQRQPAYAPAGDIDDDIPF